MPLARVEKAGSDQSWLATTAGIYHCLTGTIQIDSKNAANWGSSIPSGTPLNISDLRKVKAYTGGDGELLGFLFTSQPVTGGVDGYAIDCPILPRGTIRLDRLPKKLPSVPSGTNFVFVGKAN